MANIVIAKEIKALLIDECVIIDHEEPELISLSKMVEVMWIALDVRHRNKEIQLFTEVNLHKNLRNSKEIVLEAKESDELNLEQKRLPTPPNNFPRGRRPIYVSSLDEGLDKARELTARGILVINDEVTKPYETIAMTNSGWEFKEFNASYSPYDHLLKGGILMTHYRNVMGFEWPTIIVSKLRESNTKLYYCNICMRCTTNLIVAKDSLSVLRYRLESVI